MKNKGITIIEISITIALMIVLLEGALNAFKIFNDKTQKATLANDLSSIRQALSDYAKDNGKYPNTLEGLVSAGTGTFRYLSQIPVDPTTGLADWEIKKGDSTLPSYFSGMIANYPFREGFGSLTKDYTGKNPRATIYGSAVWTTSGYSDECLIFDGVDDYVYLDNSYSNDNNTFDNVVRQRTISIYYYATALNGLPKVIYEEGGVTNGLNIYIRNSDLYSGAWSEDYGWNGSWISTVTTVNAWHHVVLVYDLGNLIMSMYYDGGFVGNAAISVGIAEHDTDDAVGACIDGTKIDTGDVAGGPKHYFSGKIDELRVYNRALSQTEVVQLYNKNTNYTWIEAYEDEYTTGEVLDVRSNNENYKDW